MGDVILDIEMDDGRVLEGVEVDCIETNRLIVEAAERIGTARPGEQVHVRRETFGWTVWTDQTPHYWSHTLSIAVDLLLGEE